MARDRHLARLRRLARRRDERETERAFVVEGPTLVHQALDAGITIEDVVVEPGAPPELLERLSRSGVAVHAVPAGSLSGVSSTVTPQPVAAVAAFCDVALDVVLEREPLVVLVAISDPGNAGTLVRSAEAAGIGAVLFCDDSVDPFSPKVVRASAGSLFRIAVVRGGDAVQVLERMGAGGLCRVASSPRGGAPYSRADLTRPLALVLGSEAHGLPARLAGVVDQWVSIPMAGGAESLNVAMAGTLLCFEVVRQRRGSEPST